MKQQVNLYQPIFRRQRKVFSAATMAQLAALVAIGLLALYGFGRWQAAGARADLATLTAQRDAAQAQVEQLSRDLGARRDVAALNDRIGRAEQALASKRQLLRWLAEQGGEQTGGFAGHVAALARQHRPGVQLDRIEIGAGGSLRIDGRTWEAGELVRYLRRLGDEAALAGIEFRTVRFERVDDRPDVGFVVSSQRLDDEASQ